MNKIYVISGPSGVGKDYLIDQILREFPDFKKPISYTDRDKRADDKADAYHFITKENFDDLIETGEIFEWEYARDERRYGSSKKEVESFLKQGFDQIKIVGPKMFCNFKKIFGSKVVGIFIKYENVELLKKRISEKRKTSSEDLEIRYQQALQDITFEKYYDYSVVNPEGHPEQAVNALIEIINKTKNEITISVAKKTDLPDLCKVHKQSWLATYAGETCGLSESDILSKDFESPAKIKAWQNSLDDKNYRLWVAKQNEKIIGFCGAKKGDRENDFSVIYILPEYQRQGIGQMFAKTVFDWLGDNKPIKIELAKCNKQAMSFYKKLGFINIKPAEPTILANGKKIEIVKMYKEI